jgi:hypothetical protein
MVFSFRYCIARPLHSCAPYLRSRRTALEWRSNFGVLFISVRSESDPDCVLLQFVLSVSDQVGRSFSPGVLLIPNHFDRGSFLLIPVFPLGGNDCLDSPHRELHSGRKLITSAVEGGKQMVAFAVCFEIAAPGPGEGHYSVCAWSGWSEKDGAGSYMMDILAPVFTSRHRLCFCRRTPARIGATSDLAHCIYNGNDYIWSQGIDG